MDPQDKPRPVERRSLREITIAVVASVIAELLLRLLDALR